jgi:3-phenylpropionate/trans-cinnamate dioxygenase ferredoxin component
VPQIFAMTTGQLGRGQLARLELHGSVICVARTATDEIYAVEDRCSHEAGSLSEGTLDGSEIECPLHSSVFDLRTGAVLGPPARSGIKTYPVVVIDGRVLVEI